MYRDPSDLHIDRDLTNFSAGFPAMTDRYIGGLLAPTVTVSDQSDKFRIFNRDLWGRLTDDLRGPGAAANEVPPMTLSRSSFYTQEHALVDKVPREQQRNADAGLDALGDATERLSNIIMLNRENAIIAAATTTSNYASGFTTTLSGTTQWSDYTNSLPISDLKTGVDAINAVLFNTPNVAIMGYAVFRKLEDHPLILERMKGAALATTTNDVMQRIFGLPPITVATAGYVNAVWGAAESVAFMFGKDVILAYSPPNPGQRQPSFMKMFTRPVASGDGAIMPTERWYDIDSKSDKVRTSIEYDLQFITVDGSGKSNGAAYLIKNAVA